MRNQDIPHIVLPMPPEMKAGLRQRHEIQRINEEIRETLQKRTNEAKEEVSKKPPLMLPENFTGRDLRVAKKLIIKYQNRKNTTLCRTKIRGLKMAT